MTTNQLFVRDYGPRVHSRIADVAAGENAPGYPPAMPSFEGLLNEREIEGLSAYVESLR